jgi:hypothetical protein
MKKRILVLGCAALISWPGDGEAQFSSRIPGIPQAALPSHGRQESRFGLDLTGYRLQGAEGDSLIGTAGVFYGRTLRIGPRVEIGFDLSLADAILVRPPGAQDGAPSASEAPETYLRGTFAYGLTVGAKGRIISFVSPEGHGIELAIGAGARPALHPLFVLEVEGDSTRRGGLFGGDGKDDADMDPPGRAPLAGRLHFATQFLIAGGFRSDRLTADVALLVEGAEEAADSPVTAYSGLAPKVGVLYRLTPGFSFGGAWWSGGAPPWADRIQHRAVRSAGGNVGLVLGFGPRAEEGTQLVIGSPTGSVAEALRLYVRSRHSF